LCIWDPKKNQIGLSFEVYRKPTTYIIIHNDSCHPNEHKTATIRYYRNRLDTYRLTPENKKKEKETIRQILANNKYDAHPIEMLHKKRRKKPQKFITTMYRNKNEQSLHTLVKIPELSQNYSRTQR